MGPIVTQDILIPQFHEQTKFRVDAKNIIKGIQMFVFGLSKKAILANTFARAVDWGYANLSTATSLDLIIVLFAYAFQIYFDFSGYSDMAIGVSYLFNIELPINFDSPYKQVQYENFEKMACFPNKVLTKYVYIPLGGNKEGKLNTCINTLIVF
jgi:D-alanyl-lipoteichoic acid acyltransferase DltB (MBOAT superfamily)